MIEIFSILEGKMFSTKPNQMGTVGAILPKDDSPYVPEGNPHSLPPRNHTMGLGSSDPKEVRQDFADSLKPAFMWVMTEKYKDLLLLHSEGVGMRSPPLEDLETEKS